MHAFAERAARTAIMDPELAASDGSCLSDFRATIGCPSWGARHVRFDRPSTGNMTLHLGSKRAKC